MALVGLTTSGGITAVVLPGWFHKKRELAPNRKSEPAKKEHEEQ